MRSYCERKDTAALSAISINLRHKRHPVIWSAKGLPSEASALIAVPQGGALVLGANLLQYHSQGASHTLVVSKHAVPGVPLPRLHYDFDRELPAATATRAAAQYPHNVQPEAVPAAAVGAARAPGALCLDVYWLAF